MSRPRPQRLRRNGRTDRAWNRWGEIDPYFAVASLPQFRQDRLAANREEFFESGDRYVEERLDELETLHCPLSTASALEFGCGVGRLLIPLARRFDRVVGVDVSPAMLGECRENLATFGITNATLESSDDGLSRLTGSFDLVHSYIVLQHIPVARGMTLIDRLLSLTADDGVACLHLSLDRREAPWRKGLYWAQQRIPGAHVLANLARGRRVSEPLIEMNEYDLRAVQQLFARHGFEQAAVEFEEHQQILTAHVSARRI